LYAPICLRTEDR